MADNVNHPAHYEASTSIECIEAMIAMFGKQAVYNFCVTNAFKYIWRHKNKNGLEDLDKAQWYLDKANNLNTEIELENAGILDVPQQKLAIKIIFPEYIPYHISLQDLLDKKRAQWQESH